MVSLNQLNHASLTRINHQVLNVQPNRLVSKSPKRNHTPRRQSPIGVNTGNGSAQQLMLQGNVMLSSHRLGSERDGIDDGPGKYREYLRGNAEIDSSSATMRAYTPN